MKRLVSIADLMTRLSTIPGLSFLHRYVLDARSMRTRFGQRKGDYEAWINTAKGAASDVRGMAGSSDDDREEEAEDSRRSGPVVGFERPPRYDDSDESAAYDDGYYEDNYGKR